MKKYKSRKEVPEKYKWDLSIYFKNDEEEKNTYKEAKKSIDKLKNYVGCTKDANKLNEYIKLSIECESLIDILYAYSFLIDDQELGRAENIEKKMNAINLINEYENSTAFFIPELIKLTSHNYEKLFNDCKELKEYKIMLDKIYREKEHALTENEEKIVSTLTNSVNNFEDISSTMLNTLHNYGKIKLENGEKETIAPNNYRNLTKNKNELIRKKVYNSFNKKADEYSTVNAMLLNDFVKLMSAISKIRNFPTAWDEKLFNLELSNKVYESLVSVTEDNLDTLKKYFKLQKKVCNLDVLHQYDLNLEMSSSNKKYTIEEAQKVLLEALSPLGEDYIKHYKKIFDERHIDYCQYKGKCGGAYSLNIPTRDARILLSYNGDMDSISTIAHEGGHDVHHQYVRENNPVQYRNVKSIVAEVASLTNECLLSNYLVEHSNNKDEKLVGLENILRVIMNNLYGAVREAKMEQDMYEYVEKGGTITKDFMDDLSYNSLKKYYGNTVKMDKYSKNQWIYRNHYYMHFYLYNYAISVSVACNVASKILSKDSEMLDKYIKFLSTGSDVLPENAFKILGVDIEDKSVYENAIKYFDSLIEKYEDIYNN